MNSIEHLRELYEYNDWANRSLVRGLKENECGQALKYLTHILMIGLHNLLPSREVNLATENSERRKRFFW